MLIGPGRPYDLIAVCLLAVGAVLLSFYFRDSPLTGVLGFPAVFFAPGYALISALFPGNREILAQSFVARREERAFNITMLERIALSFGMSAAVMAVAATVLARGLSSLNVMTVGLTVVAVTAAVSAYAAYRRSGLPPGDQFAVFIRTGGARGRPRKGLSRGEKAVGAVIVLGLVLAGAAAASGLNPPPGPEMFSEFSISGADGNLQQLPQQVAPAQSIAVRVNVISHFPEAREMKVTISAGSPVNGGSGFVSPPSGAGSLDAPRSLTFTLGPGHQWSYPITFSVPSAGPVYFVLDDGSEVKTLWMPLTAVGPGGGG